MLSYLGCIVHSPFLLMMPHLPVVSATTQCPFLNMNSVRGLPWYGYLNGMTTLPFRFMNPICPFFCTAASPSENIQARLYWASTTIFPVYETPLPI